MQIVELQILVSFNFFRITLKRQQKIFIKIFIRRGTSLIFDFRYFTLFSESQLRKVIYHISIIKNNIFCRLAMAVLKHTWQSLFFQKYFVITV